MLKQFRHTLNKNCVKRPAAVLVICNLIACSSDYKPDICTAVDVNELLCVPTDPAKTEYTIKTDSLDFIGFACMNENDFTEGKKRARKILEGLTNGF